MRRSRAMAQDQQRLWNKTLKIYWNNMRGNRLRFIVMLVLVMTAVVFGDIVRPFILSQLFEAMADFGSTGAEEDAIWRLVWLAIGASAASIAAWRTFGYNWLKLMLDLPVENARRTFSHMLDRSYSFYTNAFSGALVNQFTQFKWAGNELIIMWIFEVFTALIRVVFVFGVIFNFLPSIAIALLVWIIFYVSTVAYLVKRKSPYSRAAVKARSDVTGHFADVVSNIFNVKNYARRDFETKRFERALQRERKANKASWFFTEHIRSYQAALGLTFQAFVLYVTAQGVVDGTISFAVVVLIQFYILRLNQDIFSVSKVIQDIERKFNDAHEMVEIFEQPITVSDAVHPKKLAIGNGHIVFKDMTFIYSDGEEKVFDKFNLEINAGQKVGLVGHSGSGKSSIVKLLLRYEDLSGGEITIDGQNIAEIKQEDLRSQIAVVPQEPVLFHRSIADNIRYGNPKATDTQVIEAAKKANAHQFISELPKGYKTLVGERGIKLSGGEKQRVAIARAMLSRAPILLLDEATSALDSKSETLIQQALTTLMENRTTLVVAHRLSTIKAMDRIIVLHKGAILEDGSHEELIARDGNYASLWSHQAGGFLAED